MPLECDGRLTFSCRARSDSANATVTLYVLGGDLKWQTRKTFPVSGAWGQCVIQADEPTLAGPDFFRVRIDSSVASTVDIADAKVIWEDDQAAAATTVPVSRGRP